MNPHFVAKQLSEATTKRQVQNLSFFVGFDGFIDSIYRCVKSRTDASTHTYMSRMEEFSTRIIQAHGKSTNIELVLQEERLGGNGPILANALVTLGSQVSLVGALGYPQIEPLFEPLSKKCTECISIAPSGKTDALEFSDGKLLLGKHTSILTLDEKIIIDHVGKSRLIALLENCKVFASANWTMLFGMTAFWKVLDSELLSNLKQKPEWMFVDIADPAKRLDADILEALLVLTNLQKHLKVVLGLNVAEAQRVSKVLGCQSGAASLCKALKIEQVVIHAIQEAEAANQTDFSKITGPYVSKPILTTGGGDNFNAGYMLGLGLNLDLESCLYLATYTSGYYVQYAKSPTLEELTAYLGH